MGVLRCVCRGGTVCVGGRGGGGDGTVCVLKE